jgi:hypothetical protein
MRKPIDQRFDALPSVLASTFQPGSNLRRHSYFRGELIFSCEYAKTPRADHFDGVAGI